MTSSEILKLRSHLKLDVPTFARVCGVDQRTVTRWESGSAAPTGAALAVLLALKEKLSRTTPDKQAEFINFVSGAAAIGGLAFLLIKLFDSLLASKTRNLCHFCGDLPLDL